MLLLLLALLVQVLALEGASIHVRREFDVSSREAESERRHSPDHAADPIDAKLLQLTTEERWSLGGPKAWLNAQAQAAKEIVVAAADAVGAKANDMIFEPAADRVSSALGHVSGVLSDTAADVRDHLQGGDATCVYPSLSIAKSTDELWTLGNLILEIRQAWSALIEIEEEMTSAETLEKQATAAKKMRDQFIEVATPAVNAVVAAELRDVRPVHVKFPCSDHIVTDLGTTLDGAKTGYMHRGGPMLAVAMLQDEKWLATLREDDACAYKVLVEDNFCSLHNVMYYLESHPILAAYVRTRNLNSKRPLELDVFSPPGTLTDWMAHGNDKMDPFIPSENLLAKLMTEDMKEMVDKVTHRLCVGHTSNSGNVFMLIFEDFHRLGQRYMTERSHDSDLADNISVLVDLLLGIIRSPALGIDIPDSMLRPLTSTEKWHTIMELIAEYLQGVRDAIAEDPNAESFAFRGQTKPINADFQRSFSKPICVNFNNWVHRFRVALTEHLSMQSSPILREFQGLPNDLADVKTMDPGFRVVLDIKDTLTGPLTVAAYTYGLASAGLPIAGIGAFQASKALAATAILRKADHLAVDGELTAYIFRFGIDSLIRLCTAKDAKDGRLFKIHGNLGKFAFGFRASAWAPTDDQRNLIRACKRAMEFQITLWDQESAYSSAMAKAVYEMVNSDDLVDAFAVGADGDTWPSTSEKVGGEITMTGGIGFLDKFMASVFESDIGLISTNDDKFGIDPWTNQFRVPYTIFLTPPLAIAYADIVTKSNSARNLMQLSDACALFSYLLDDWRPSTFELSPENEDMLLSRSTMSSNTATALGKEFLSTLGKNTKELMDMTVKYAHETADDAHDTMENIEKWWGELPADVQRTMGRLKTMVEEGGKAVGHGFEAAKQTAANGGDISDIVFDFLKGTANNALDNLFDTMREMIILKVDLLVTELIEQGKENNPVGFAPSDLGKCVHPRTYVPVAELATSTANYLQNSEWAQKAWHLKPEKRHALAAVLRRFATTDSDIVESKCWSVLHSGEQCSEEELDRSKDRKVENLNYVYDNIVDQALPR